MHVKISVMSESYDRTNESYNVFFSNEIEDKCPEQQDDHFFKFIGLKYRSMRKIWTFFVISNHKNEDKLFISRINKKYDPCNE